MDQDIFYYDNEPSRRNYIRPLIAIVLVIVLLAAGSYAALRPWLHQDADFDAVLLGISADYCGNIHRQRIIPTNVLCVCGRLFAEADSISYSLWLRTAEGETLGQYQAESQTDQTFCHQVRLPSRLETGRYAIEIRPLAGDRVIDTYWFDVDISLPPGESA